MDSPEKIRCTFKAQHGASMVEAAIVLPVIVTVLLLFWDTMAMITCTQRHYSSLIQLAINPQDKPLLLASANIVDSSGAAVGTKISISALDNNQADSYLRSLANNLFAFLGLSGPFASSVNYSAVLRLFYLAVDKNTGQIVWLTGDPTFGDGYYTERGTVVIRHGNKTAPCLTAANQAKALSKLDSYAMGRLSELNPHNSTPYAKAIGFQMYNIPLSPALFEYLTIKPIVFGLLCSDYSILGRDPALTTFVLTPSRDVGLDT